MDEMAEVLAAQYPSLVRLAAMLLDDASSAEDVVQEAYVRVAARRRRLRDPNSAPAYLRQAVVNLSRTWVRRRRLAERHRRPPDPDPASAEEGAMEAFERQAVVRGLRALPRRQREVLVLRYYLDLTIEATAHELGLSPGAVKSYASRGLARLGDLIAGEVTH